MISRAYTLLIKQEGILTYSNVSGSAEEAVLQEKEEQSQKCLFC